MNFLYNSLLRCPLDQLALTEVDRQLRCENGHSFDIARQGYVNLLGPADKRSQDPGDSKAMVAARREFLQTGYFQPVARKLAELVAPLTGAHSVIVDAGCGEGYYLDQLRTALLVSSPTPPAMIGFDISKWAVQAATRRVAATWLVASNRSIPLAHGSADCLLSLFGFPVFAAFHAVLKPGGTVVIASAGPQHLIELREIIYPSVRQSTSGWLEQAQSAGFSTGETASLCYKTAALNPLEIKQLLAMTPHLHRASREGMARAAQLDCLAVTVEVVFQLLHKPHEAGIADRA